MISTSDEMNQLTHILKRKINCVSLLSCFRCFISLHSICGCFILKLSFKKTKQKRKQEELEADIVRLMNEHLERDRRPKGERRACVFCFPSFYESLSRRLSCYFVRRFGWIIHHGCRPPLLPLLDSIFSHRRPSGHCWYVVVITLFFVYIAPPPPSKKRPDQ